MNNYERVIHLYMPPEFIAECIYCPGTWSNLLPIPSDPLLRDLVNDLKKEHRRFKTPRVPNFLKPNLYLQGITRFSTEYPICRCTPQLMRYIIKTVRISIGNHGIEELFKFNRPDRYANIIMHNRKTIVATICCIRQIKIHNKYPFWKDYIQAHKKTPYDDFSEIIGCLQRQQPMYEQAIQEIILEIAERHSPVNNE